MLPTGLPRWSVAVEATLTAVALAMEMGGAPSPWEGEEIKASKSNVSAIVDRGKGGWRQEDGGNDAKRLLRGWVVIQRLVYRRRYRLKQIQERARRGLTIRRALA